MEYDQMRFIFQYSPPCSSHSPFICVAVLGNVVADQKNCHLTRDRLINENLKGDVREMVGSLKKTRKMMIMSQILNGLIPLSQILNSIFPTTFEVGSPFDVVTNVLDCTIIESESEIKSHYVYS